MNQRRCLPCWGVVALIVTFCCLFSIVVVDHAAEWWGRFHGDVDRAKSRGVRE